MPNQPPDFYLASTEGYNLNQPRRCWRIRRLATQHRDDLLLIRAEPPVLSDSEEETSDEVIITTRHEGASLFPITQWPVYVYVAVPKTPIADSERIDAEGLRTVAWAELYPTWAAAERKQM